MNRGRRTKGETWSFKTEWPWVGYNETVTNNERLGVGWKPNCRAVWKNVLDRGKS